MITLDLKYYASLTAIDASYVTFIAHGYVIVSYEIEDTTIDFFINNDFFYPTIQLNYDNSIYLFGIAILVTIIIR